MAPFLILTCCALLCSSTDSQAAVQDTTLPPQAVAESTMDTAPSTIEQIRRRGTLRYTSIPEQMNGFLALDLEALKRTGRKKGRGIDYDLVELLAERLGVEPELVLPSEPNLSELWACLESRQADLAVGGLSILPERTKRFDFSEPYYQTDLAVIAPTDSPWETIEETRNLRLAIIPGASSAAYWFEIAKPTGEIVEADFTIGVVSRVAEGQADIGVEDVALVRSHVESLDEVEILFRIPIDDHYGIVFQKGSELTPLMNEILQELKESGELQAILDRHLR